MFATIQEAKQAYVDSFTKFVAWRNELKEAFKSADRKFDLLDLGKGDWEKYKTWGTQLVGMEKTLGLTPEEVLEIELKLGFRTKP
jgi:hypothetical protein